MKKLIALSALTVLSATAFAENKTETGVNYNEVSVGYVSQDITMSGTKYTFTGYGLTAAALVSENFFLSGSYGATSNTTSGTKTNIDQSKVGLGYRLPISDATDFNIFGSYSNTSVTSSADSNATSVGIGIRSIALSPDLETNLSYIYTSSKKLDTTTNGSGYQAGLKYKMTSNWFIDGNYLSRKDFNQYYVGVGYRF